jgi:hypothetical protein
VRLLKMSAYLKELNDRARQVVPLCMSFPRLRFLQEHVAYHDARTPRIADVAQKKWLVR